MAPTMSEHCRTALLVVLATSLLVYANPVPGHDFPVLYPKNHSCTQPTQSGRAQPYFRTIMANAIP
jgi:hypothetical protein